MVQSYKVHIDTAILAVFTPQKSADFFY